MPHHEPSSTYELLRRSLFKIRGALLAVFALLGAWLLLDLQRGYEKVLVEMSYRAMQRSQIISQSFRTEILSTDYVLRDVLGRIQEKDIVYPDVDSDHAARMTNLLKEKSATVPNFFLIVFNKDCLFTATQTGNHTGASSKQELCETRKRHTGSALLVSYVSGTKSASGKAVLMLSRHLQSPAGDFQGGVMAVMELEKTQHWFDALHLEPGDSVALLDRDQMLLVRQPLAVEAMEKPVTTPVISAVTHSAASQASATTQRDVDGRERLFGFSRVEGFPFAIAYGYDRVMALHDWRWRAVELTTGYFILLLFAWLVSRYQGTILRQRDELRSSEEHFRMLAENMADIVWCTDAQMHFTYVNPADQKMRGYAPKEVIGTHVMDNLTQQGKDILNQKLRERSALEMSSIHGIAMKYELPMQHKDGHEVWIEISSVPIYGRDGTINGYQGVGRDIGGRRQHEANLLQSQRQLENRLYAAAAEKSVLQELATRDPLTGLNNRRYLDDALLREFAQAKCDGKPLAVIMLDLDYFKHVNDQYGHAAGDEVIKALAAILKKGARESDLICRYGGEEFVAVMPNMAESLAWERAEVWRKQLEDSSVIYEDFKINITLSAGIALFPDHGENAEQVFARADEMLYKSKREGRNQIHVFQSN